MSAILSADDLNDFISPGVACIKPVELQATETAGEVEIQIDENGKPLQISKIDGKISALAPAQISLSDCLACSGCITSAEEVLVAQHSHDQFLKAIKEGNKTFVASISHQLRVSLAQAYGYSLEEMDRILVHFFKDQMGFAFVVGTALGRKLSLLEESARTIKSKLANGSDHKPILSSICPGWVLYAEKTHPHVLPYLSLVKSPQQITGCLLKSLAAEELGCSRSDIYHLSIMPCFDKKLESARPEEDDASLPGPDVDCVLTAKELVQLLEISDYELIPSKSLDASQPITQLYSSCAPRGWPLKELSWSNDSGSESGGYGYNYIYSMRDYLLKIESSYTAENFSIHQVEGRNSDIHELRLMYDGKKVASAAIVNGFRNIQNLVRKLKPSTGPTVKANPLAARRRARINAKSASSLPSPAPEEAADASKADYVEVMACPSGCINGGGQISRPQEVSEREWLAQAKHLYWNIATADVLEDNSLGDMLRDWSTEFQDKTSLPKARLYDTHFNEVEKPQDAATIMLGSKW